MKSLIQIGVRIFLVVSAGIPLASASAQLAPGSAQPIGVMSTPQGQIPVFGEGQLPLFSAGSLTRARNGTPAQRAAEATVEAAKSERLQEDIANGEALMKAGDLDGAVDAFQQILASNPNDGLAYRRMAEAYAAAGKLPEASRAFHKVLVEGFGPGIGNGVGDTPDEWAEYALVLVKTGRPAEAVQCYNHAAHALDYEDSENHGGKPFLQVLFPEVVMGDALPKQVPYTPEHLQALADAVLAHEEMGSGNSKEALAHNREAVKLYPDSAPVQYYLGEALSDSYYTVLDSPIKDKATAQGTYEEEKRREAAYQKAAELGDEATAAAAKERLKVLR